MNTCWPEIEAFLQEPRVVLDHVSARINLLLLTLKYFSGVIFEFLGPIVRPDCFTINRCKFNIRKCGFQSTVNGSFVCSINRYSLNCPRSCCHQLLIFLSLRLIGAWITTTLHRLADEYISEVHYPIDVIGISG